MIVLRTPKGWTGPKEVDGHKVEDFWRSHQVPFSDVATNAGAFALLEDWLRATGRRSSSTRTDGSCPSCGSSPPKATRRMGANPHANGGALLRDLRLPDFRDYAVEVTPPGAASGGGDARAGHLPPRRA